MGVLLELPKKTEKSPPPSGKKRSILISTGFQRRPNELVGIFYEVEIDILLANTEVLIKTDITVVCVSLIAQEKFCIEKRLRLESL